MYPRVFWVVALSGSVLLAAVPSWRDKALRDWTEEDAQQVLTDSPWAKTTTVNIFRMETEFERREGGNMGQEHGVGYDGVDGNKTKSKAAADFFKHDINGVNAASKPAKVLLRWESALPVRVAELKAHVIEPPTTSTDGYFLAVYGVPGNDFKEDPATLGNPLKKLATLKREGKKDVKPSSVEVFQRDDGLVVVYIFPLSAEIGKNDGRIEFDAQIGRLGVAQYFEPAEMIFQGKLEL